MSAKQDNSRPVDEQCSAQTTLAALPNAVVTREQFFTTPSMREGVPRELEDQLRMLGCELIQSAGILLKL
jgi:hypothetical protein